LRGAGKSPARRDAIFAIKVIISNSRGHLWLIANRWPAGRDCKQRKFLLPIVKSVVLPVATLIAIGDQAGVKSS
jgi:hypothetical protein